MAKTKKRSIKLKEQFRAIDYWGKNFQRSFWNKSADLREVSQANSTEICQLETEILDLRKKIGSIFGHAIGEATVLEIRNGE